MAAAFIYHTSDAIRSFKTGRSRALVERMPWIITTETKVGDALELLSMEDHADLVVLDAATGSVTGLLSNFETTTTLSSKKKKKKAEATLGMQAQCHTLCESECASRGGCLSHGLADYGGSVGAICTIICRDGRDQTIGEVFNGQTLPG